MPPFNKAGFAPALLAGLSLLAAHSARAQNLVQDGGFESADPGASAGAQDYSFTSADPFDDFWAIPAGTAGIDTENPFVYDGSKSLYLNADDAGGTTTIQQTLATTPGASYTLSFYADDDGDNPLTVGFGSTVIGPISIPQNGYPNADPGSNAGSFTFFTYSVTAQSAQTALDFSAMGNSDGSNIELDDISVTAAPIPEASTLVSLGLMLGLGGVAVALRKKRAAA